MATGADIPTSVTMEDIRALTGNTGGPAAGLIPPAGKCVEAGYSLPYAGTVDKQTQNLHGIVICTSKLTSSAHNATPEKYLRVGSRRCKAWGCGVSKKGSDTATKRWRADRISYFRKTGRAS